MTAFTFLYTAFAEGQQPETFTSNVEYLAGDELPLSSARWQVDRVAEAGTGYSEEGRTLMRYLYCTIKD
jgi:hypothetical protein